MGHPIEQCCGKLTLSAAAARPGWSVSVQVGAAHRSAYHRAVLWIRIRSVAGPGCLSRI
jgi:hypothetical protein